MAESPLTPRAARGRVLSLEDRAAQAWEQRQWEVLDGLMAEGVPLWFDPTGPLRTAALRKGSVLQRTLGRWRGPEDVRLLEALTHHPAWHPASPDLAYRLWGVWMDTSRSNEVLHWLMAQGATLTRAWEGAGSVANSSWYWRLSETQRAQVRQQEPMAALERFDASLVTYTPKGLYAPWEGMRAHVQAGGRLTPMEASQFWEAVALRYAFQPHERERLEGWWDFFEAHGGRGGPHTTRCIRNEPVLSVWVESWRWPDQNPRAAWLHTLMVERATAPLDAPLPGLNGLTLLGYFFQHQMLASTHSQEPQTADPTVVRLLAAGASWEPEDPDACGALGLLTRLPLEPSPRQRLAQVLKETSAWLAGAQAQAALTPWPAERWQQAFALWHTHWTSYWQANAGQSEAWQEALVFSTPSDEPSTGREGVWYRVTDQWAEVLGGSPWAGDTPACSLSGMAQWPWPDKTFVPWVRHLQTAHRASWSAEEWLAAAQARLDAPGLDQEAQQRQVRELLVLFHLPEANQVLDARDLYALDHAGWVTLLADVRGLHQAASAEALPSARRRLRL